MAQSSERAYVPPSTPTMPVMIFRRDVALPTQSAAEAAAAKPEAAVVRAQERFRAFVAELVKNAGNELFYFARAQFSELGRGMVVVPYECIDDPSHFTTTYVRHAACAAALYGPEAPRMVGDYNPLAQLVLFMALPVVLASGVATFLRAPMKLGPFALRATPEEARETAICHNPHCPIVLAPSFNETSSFAGVALSRCGGCKFTLYCSKACQHADWTERHRAECASLRDRNFVRVDTT